MKTFKKIGEGFLIAAFVFLFIVLIFESYLEVPVWLKIAGRMHPMFLHFPIVLLLLSFLSLWIPSHEQTVWNWFDGLRLVAVISAVITAIMGLLLSLEEGEITQILQWHKWGGIAISILALIFYAWSNFFIRHKMTGKGFTILAGLLIFLTGHWGAGLTHGDNYLLEPMGVDRKVPIEEAVVYNDVIKPILQKKCLSCHRDGNMKGGLMMETIAGMLKGGKTGPLFVPGKPEISLMMERIHLPENEKKHMPPASKPDLTEDEAALLYAWIRSGALMKEKLVTLPVQDSFRLLASRTLGASDVPEGQIVYDFPPADDKTIASLNNNYRVIEPLGMGAAALSVHFYGLSAFSTKALQELLAIKQQVTELSLARMPVKDEDLKTISQFPNINRLNLNYTDISGKGLQHLTALKKLQHLSLSGTQIEASALQQVASLPQLSHIYIWDTPVDSVQVQQLKNKYNNLNIETGFADNKEEIIALSPPTFYKPGGLLEKPATIELKHPIRGVQIRYTTDGTDPDSVRSTVYSKPLIIDSTVTLKARAFKDGWYGSNTVKSAYIMRKVKPDSVTLLTLADVKYPLLSNDQLCDGELGDMNFGNGQWVGFQKNDAGFLVYYHQPVSLSSVLINLMKNTRSHIFPPVKIEVWGGMDKQQMKLLGVIKPKAPEQNEPAQAMQEQVKFPSTPLQFIKINIEKWKSLPSWHDSKGKPAWVMVSEIIAN